MLSRLKNLSEVSKITLASILVAIVLGACVGSVVYTATENSRAGCYATHAVIRNLDDYFEAQLHRLESGAFGSHLSAAQRQKSIKGYRSVIRALGQVRCR